MKADWQGSSCWLSWTGRFFPEDLVGLKVNLISEAAPEGFTVSCLSDLQQIKTRSSICCDSMRSRGGIIFPLYCCECKHIGSVIQYISGSADLYQVYRKQPKKGRKCPVSSRCQVRSEVRGGWTEKWKTTVSQTTICYKQVMQNTISKCTTCQTLKKNLRCTLGGSILLCIIGSCFVVV